MLLIIDVKNFMCLIFAVWLNHKSFLPSKLLQTMVDHEQHQSISCYVQAYLMKSCVIYRKSLATIATSGGVVIAN